MRKPNWACASCGMYSSRKSSVKRHIQNIHSGNVFVDYLAGRKSGIYWPIPPTYQRKSKKSTDYMNIMSEEVSGELIRRNVGMPNSNLFKFFGGSI